MIRRAGLLLAVFIGLIVVATAVGRVLTGVGSAALDQRALSWLVALRSAALNSAMLGVTFLGSTFWLVCLVLLVAAWLLARRLPMAAVVLVLALAGATAIDNIVKVFVGRPRPPDVTHLVSTATFSFPSGHACSAAAVYLALALVLRERGPVHRAAIAVAIIVAATIAISRVYLGVHYPTDVVAGLLLGWAWASVLVLVARAHNYDKRPLARS